MTGPNVTNGDSYLSFPTAVSILHDADLDVDEFRSPEVRDHYGVIRLGTAHYDRYPWPVALLLLPAVVAVDGAHQLGIGAGATGLVESDQMGLVQLVTASAVTALAVVVVYRLVLARVEDRCRARRRIAVAIALGFAFATPAWSTASRALWQHGPSMLFLALALLVAVVIEDRGPSRSEAAPTAMRLFGAALAAAYVVRPSNAVAVVVFSLWVLVRYRRHVGPFVVGATAVAVPWLIVNMVSYGVLIPPYHSAGRIGLHADYAEAVAANLVSPARGVLVFSPIVLLSVAGVLVRRHRRELSGLDVAAAATVVLYLLVVSGQNEGWWAGHAFGPRFLTDTLPLLALLAIPAVAALWKAMAGDRPSRPAQAGALVCALALVWSVVVHAQGPYLRAVNCWNVEPTNVDDDPRRVWSLRGPQFLSGYRAVRESGVEAAVLGRCRTASLAPPAPAPDGG